MEKIETVEVANLMASAVWEKLKPATRYTWYVEVENNKGGLVYSDMVTFTTKEKMNNVNSGEKHSESKDTNSSYKGIRSKEGDAGEKQKKEAVVVENNVFQNQQIPEQQVPLGQTPQLKGNESVVKVTGEKNSDVEKNEMLHVEETIGENDIEQGNAENDEKSEKENVDTESQGSENVVETNAVSGSGIEENTVWYLALLGLIIAALAVIAVYIKLKSGKEDR